MRGRVIGGQRRAERGATVDWPLGDAPSVAVLALTSCADVCLPLALKAVLSVAGFTLAAASGRFIINDYITDVLSTFCNRVRGDAVPREGMPLCGGGGTVVWERGELSSSIVFLWHVSSWFSVSELIIL